MLKGIHSLLRGDLLMHIDQLGHGDTCLIADANFPAHRLSETVVEISAADSPTVLAAVLTVFPLDPYEGPAVTLMSSENDTVAGPQAAQPMLKAFSEVVGGENIVSLPREDFYEATRSVRFIIRTGELRPYGNVMLRKGVVND
jgi:L-fucose mutarotase